MKETTKNNTTNKSSNSSIEIKRTKPSPTPTRKEFHKYASNELSEGDFCTNHPSGYQVSRVAHALNWTYSNEKKRNNTYTYSNYRKMKG
ncbi:MAG: hypothetical protein IJA10_10555 [Lachnospiraceae bacterium]|nr:hypothetical protein [Lachnospiraceae bacterium]